jgi:hypothetical protein
MDSVNGFRSSHAVVIGINDYQHGIPRLRTAVNDARRIAEVLETRFGYSVQLLAEDVTRDRLITLFAETLRRSTVTTASLSTSPATASRWTATTDRPDSSSRRTRAPTTGEPSCR